ncbi:MAG: methylornithine synthase PylB [Desulfobacteraceae bacterium]|nr:MAG: methylornithine synthase PylB [Desulfobacteraceae bacterium]
MSRFRLSDILHGRLDHGGGVSHYQDLSNDQIKCLLNLSEPEDLDMLFRAARAVRHAYFGNTVFLYGFLYFSTHCRNNCCFCQYRRDNTGLIRYRKSQKEILQAAVDMRNSGIHLVDLTMGEDPGLYSAVESGQKPLTSMVRQVMDATGLPVMISPGAVSDQTLNDLADAGADWYACYQETHSPNLYKTLRPGQSYGHRVSRKQHARSLGMLIEEGILTGVGETSEEIADSIQWMCRFGVDQARVMTFVPQDGTPMADKPFQGSLKERIIIAVMRLVLGDVLIPASLDVDGLDGLEARINAGANVVTSIVPPDQGLAGVANPSLDIEDSRRTLDRILPVIRTCGLEPATAQEYQQWIINRQRSVRDTPRNLEKCAC